MLEDPQQQALVADGVPPQGWQLRVVGIRNPDLDLTEDEEAEEEGEREDEEGQQDEVTVQRSRSYEKRAQERNIWTSERDQFVSTS